MLTNADVSRVQEACNQYTCMNTPHYFHIKAALLKN
jgi:hypothetical protein